MMDELRKKVEIEFLKSKTHEEINDMFNQLNDKLKMAIDTLRFTANLDDKLGNDFIKRLSKETLKKLE